MEAPTNFEITLVVARLKSHQVKRIEARGGTA